MRWLVVIGDVAGHSGQVSGALAGVGAVDDGLVLSADVTVVQVGNLVDRLTGDRTAAGC